MNEQELNQQARRALDESTERLSPELQAQLFQARETAMAKQDSPRWFNIPVISFAMAASVCAILVINYFPGQQTPVNLTANSGIDDFLLVSSLDETDLEIIEDLEFAYWLSEELENEKNTNEQSTDELRNG